VSNSASGPVPGSRSGQPFAIRCTAKSSRTGEPCRAWAVRGARVCSAHGGRAPQVAAAAKRRLLEQDVMAELAKLDLEPLGDPLTQLALLAAQAAWWKDAMAERVNRLTSLRYEGTGSGEQLRAEVALWERALDRCEKFLSSMARLNIDERLAKISEDQGRLIADFVGAALRHFGIDYGDPGAYEIVMGLFERWANDEPVKVAIETPHEPALTPVCEMNMHNLCKSYARIEGMAEPPPWPQRCPCDCHDPARQRP
jgi:hypothetical protein